jgi:hypothetical protein
MFGTSERASHSPRRESIRPGNPDNFSDEKGLWHHAPSRRRCPQTPSRLGRLVPRERARRHVVPFASMCTHLGHRQSGACRELLVVSLEREAEFVIRDAQITVRVARDRRWHDVLHFLRHHADVRRVPADVGEAVIAQAVVEASQQHDVILQPYVGANGNV